MKLTCDLCGSALTVNAAETEAVCPNCGMGYGADRLAEKRYENRDETRSPVRGVQEEAPAASKKDKARMRLMWIILAMIGLYTFIGALAGNAVVFVVCAAAALLTLAIFKPWKVYGGNAI